MIPKIICWMFGHRFKAKATVREFQTVNQFTGLPQTGFYYRWEQQSHCLRCNKPNPNYPGFITRKIKEEQVIK